MSGSFPSYCTSANPQPGFRRYRFLFCDTSTGKFESFIVAGPTRNGRVFDESGTLVASVDGSDSVHLSLRVGDEVFEMPRKASNCIALSATGEPLVSIRRTGPWRVLPFTPLLALPIAILALVFGKDPRAADYGGGDFLKQIAVFMPLVLLIAALATVRRSIRVEGAECKFHEGVGLGDYRIEVGGKTAISVYRDNGRTFDDYDVDVAEGFNAKAALVLILSIESLLPGSPMSGVPNRERAFQPRGPRPGNA